jgi:hypothetical protein
MFRDFAIKKWLQSGKIEQVERTHQANTGHVGYSAGKIPGLSAESPGIISIFSLPG